MDFDGLMGQLGNETPEQAAARALSKALRADTTGRPLELRFWKTVIAQELGVGKLHQKRLDGVVLAGERLGLFKMEGGTFTLLDAPEPKAVEPPPVEPEPEPDPEPEPKPPKDKKPYTYPDLMPCGHSTLWKQADGSCLGCEQKASPSWRYLGEHHDEIIPPRLRRTQEKMDTGGFGGLCCTPDGYYIGGLGNDCRYYRPPGIDPCDYHKAKPKG